MIRANMADLLFPHCVSDGLLSTVCVLQVVYLIVRVWFSVNVSSDEHSLLRKSLSEKENYRQIEGRSPSGRLISIYGSRMFPLKTWWPDNIKHDNISKYTEAQHQHQTTCHSRQRLFEGLVFQFMSGHQWREWLEGQSDKFPCVEAWKHEPWKCKGAFRPN